MKRITTIAISLLFASIPAGAADRWWDTNSATAGAGGASPSGVWDTGSTANWTSNVDGTIAATTWANNDSAFFAAGDSGVDPATGAYTVTLGSNITLNGLRVYRGSPTLTGPFTLTKAGTTPTFTVNGGTTTLNANIISATNYGLIKTGSGTLVLAGDNTYSPSNNTAEAYWLIVNAGVFRITGGTHANPSYLMTGRSGNDTAQTFEQTGGTFNQTGDVYFSNQTNGGNTTVNFSGGVFNATGRIINLAQRRNATMTVSGTADVRVGVLQANRDPDGVTGRTATLHLNGGTLTATRLENDAGNSGLFNINFNGGTLKAAGNSATFIATSVNNVTINAGGATIDSNSFSITLPEAMGGAGGLTKTGAGTLTLGANNAYAGATNVNQGTVSLTGQLNGGGAIAVNNDAVFNQSLAGGISGAASFTHDSTGISVLEGTNSLAGPTAVKAGKLLVNGSLAGAGLVTVSAGATLGGSGSAPAVTFDGGGFLAPGQPDLNDNQLNLASLALNPSSILLFDLAAPQAKNNFSPSFYNDHIALTGGLVLDGMLRINAVAGFAVDEEQRWILMSYPSGKGHLDDRGLQIDLANSTGLPVLPAGKFYAIDTAMDGYVFLSVVPEPGTGVLVLLGLLLFRRRVRVVPN